MHFFTKYSLFVNIFFIIVVVSSIMYISYMSLEGGINSNGNYKDNSKVELTAYNLNYNEYDKDGDFKTNLTSCKIEHYTNQDVKMTDLIEKIYDKKTSIQTWEVKSKYGFYSKEINDNLIHLYGGVNAIIYLNKKIAHSKDEPLFKYNNKDSPNTIYIRTSDMYYNTDSKDYYNNHFVKIYDPETGNNTTGLGLQYNSSQKIISLNKNVRSYYASS